MILARPPREGLESDRRQNAARVALLAAPCADSRAPADRRRFTSSARLGRPCQPELSIEASNGGAESTTLLEAVRRRVTLPLSTTRVVTAPNDHSRSSGLRRRCASIARS